METWENLEKEDLQRFKVPGGWLVRTGIYSGDSMSMCFLPDPEHLWEK